MIGMFTLFGWCQLPDPKLARRFLNNVITRSKVYTHFGYSVSLLSHTIYSASTPLYSAYATNYTPYLAHLLHLVNDSS